ncbi:MAG: hypothetical protein ACRC92_12210, partial [Peptostreptococcaceae bacterium]
FFRILTKSYWRKITVACNNILAFENLIQVPTGIDYEIPSGTTTYYVAVNTDNLDISAVPGKYPTSNIGNICRGKELSGEVELYEIRVSGYLNYSVSVKCLKSSNNFVVNTPLTENPGCISSSSMLPISADDINNKLPYIVIGYLPVKPVNLEVEVALTDINLDSPQEINGNYFIVVRGIFNIYLK